jgi:bile acid:Na+ symporter, BASS family
MIIIIIITSVPTKTINSKFPKFVQAIQPFSPLVGVVVTCILVGVSVSGTALPIVSAGLSLQCATALLHLLGGTIGYLATKPFYPEPICRTFAIEFAMKSSAFGYLLATLHFTNDFAVRVPSAVSIVWMTLIGSTMAVLSRYFPPSSSSNDVCPVDE